MYSICTTTTTEFAFIWPMEATSPTHPTCPHLTRRFVCRKLCPGIIHWWYGPSNSSSFSIREARHDPLAQLKLMLPQEEEKRRLSFGSSSSSSCWVSSVFRDTKWHILSCPHSPCSPSRWSTCPSNGSRGNFFPSVSSSIINELSELWKN